MITRRELEDYARLKQLNVGQAEKDYILTLVLFLLSKYKELVLKGGTALAKSYNLDRFSEDIDFTVINFKFDIGGVMLDTKKELEQFGIKLELKEVKTVADSKKFHLKAEGPLFNGNPSSVCRIVLDFSFRERLLLEPSLRKINHQLNEIPLFEIKVMNLSEIFAEKVRALLTRNKARDAYDLMFLMDMNVNATKKIINTKLEYYKEELTLSKFKAALNNKEGIWESELKFLVRNIPDFKVIKKRLTGFIEGMLK